MGGRCSVLKESCGNQSLTERKWLGWN